MSDNLDILGGADLTSGIKKSSAGAGIYPPDDKTDSGESPDPGTSWMTRLLIKYSFGLIKDTTQASYVLVAFSCVMLLVSIFLLFGGGRRTADTPKDVKILSAEF